MQPKKHEKYDPTSDLKTCGHILFETLGSIFFQIVDI